MQVPILGRRRERKQAEMVAAIEASVEKTISPALAMAAAQSQASSGATYAVNPSSPFNQLGPGQGFVPLPRPDGYFDSGFGPGFPLIPDAIDPVGPNGRTMPRRAQYLISANLQLIDRRLPWSVLSGLAEDVDIIARCLQIVQDAIVGLDWSWGFSPTILNQIMTEQGITNSAKANAIARDKYGDEMQRVTEFFEYPDKRMGFSFSQWLTDIIYSHLVYDGIVISPQYNLGGELISLSTIDTPTIKILLDNQGFVPQPPAPAYQQILYGFPRGEYQAENVSQDGDVPGGFEQDQLAYYIRRPHPSSVYGYSQVEECVNIASIYMQRQAWMHAEYSHGVTPKLLIETPGTETWTPEQLGYYERALNDMWSGQSQRRQQAMLLRGGMTATQLKSVDEAYSSSYDEYLILQIGAKFGIPQSQLGIQMRSSMGQSGATKGQTDQSQMFATDALKNFLIDCINDMARRFMGVGPELTMTATGGGTEDDDVQRSTADASDVGAGIRTRNEIRAERGIPLIDEPEADQLGVTSPTGVTFLSGLLDQQEQNAQINAQLGAAQAAQAANPTSPEATDDSNAGQQPGDSGTGPTSGQGAKPNGPGPSGGSGSAQSGGTAKPASKPAAKPNVTAKDDVRQPDTDAEKELAAFAKFAKARLESGKSWRPFEFRYQDDVRALALNNAGASGDYEVVKELLSKRDDTPSKAEDTERLMTYWADGKGRLKINWGVDGDFDRCRAELGKYVDPDQLDGLCANLHHRATGFWPGHAPGESESGGHKKSVPDYFGSRLDFTLTKASQSNLAAFSLELQERVASYFASKIADAMKDADGIDAAIEAAQKLWPKATKAAGDEPPPLPSGEVAATSGADPQAAIVAVGANVTFDTQAIQNVLTDLYANAGIAGAGVASQALGTVEGSDFASVLPTINWATWTPGDLDAARLVANGGLRQTLDDADIVLRGITDSAIDRMGNELANGLNLGLAPATIADNMRAIVSDPKRALVIARTETGRAQVASSMDSYRANDTEMVDWHSNMGACPACIALDENGPYPIDDAPDFPHHPNDRCQVLPHVDLD